MRRVNSRIACVQCFGSLILFRNTFRRHVNAFWLAIAITMLGVLFGGCATLFDEEAKAALVPPMFAHVMQSPTERIDAEESSHGPDASKTQFSAMLMTNNIKVSLFAMALGMTYGIGTIALLFYNGAILGLVTFDFVATGSRETVFMIGWLLPHGSIEIPAILLGGQAGLMLAGALVGWGKTHFLCQSPARTRARSRHHRLRNCDHASLGRHHRSLHFAVPQSSALSGKNNFRRYRVADADCLPDFFRTARPTRMRMIECMSSLRPPARLMGRFKLLSPRIARIGNFAFALYPCYP